MRIELIQADEAQALLVDPAFREQWRLLLAQCPWATGFQSPGFVFTWYEMYRQAYRPMLAIARSANGFLLGALPLAQSISDGALAAAGSWHAQYQCWITRPELGDEFARAAFDALQPHLPASGLHLRYLPPGTPTGPLAGMPVRSLSIFKPHIRPLIRLDCEREFAATLAKHGNKSRLRKLKHLGPVQFVRITDRAEFVSTMQTLALWHDARRMAVNGAAPFRNDSLKMPFHLAMFAQPRLLHVTALCAGDELASMHVNIGDGHRLHLCLIAHNPWLAKASPGKLHTLMLAQMLCRDGYEELDLTPGGDLYKDRFANTFDQVHSISIYPSRARRTASAIVHGLKDRCRATLRRHELTPAQVLLATRKLRPGRVTMRLIERASGGRPQVTFSGTVPPKGFRRDAIEDLLAYMPPRRCSPSPQEFLADALARFERGEHVYTRVESGKLVRSVWVNAAPQDSAVGPTLARSATSRPVSATLDSRTPAPTTAAAMHGIR